MFDFFKKKEEIQGLKYISNGDIWVVSPVTTWVLNEGHLKYYNGDKIAGEAYGVTLANDQVVYR